MTLRLFMFLGWLLFLPLDALGLENVCAIRGNSFASCSPDNRNFRSVLLAIHGWNGSCAETFGSGERSLFKVLEENQGHRSFYDLDCFAYDTHDTALATSVDRLRDHVKALSDIGYETVTFVTHSTGGVLALRLLLDDMLTPDRKLLRQSPNPPLFSTKNSMVRSVQAWAVPINGIRSQISLGGRIVNFFNFSPAVLPELDEKSEFLQKLRSDLETFFRLYSALPGEKRSPYDFRLFVYQGASDDWVVKNIPKDAAWLAPIPTQITIVDTQSGHSHTVDDATGELGRPTFPGEIMKDKARLLVELDPRFDDLFTVKAASIPKALGQRQLKVVDGMISFLDFRFFEGVETTSRFFRVILQEEFGRADELDEKLAGDFSTLVKHRVTQETPVNALATCAIVRGVVDLFDPTKKANIQEFGKGKSNATKTILDLIQFIFERANAIAKDNPNWANAILPGVSLEDFNRSIVATQLRYLNAPDDGIQAIAEANLLANLPSISDDVIKDAGLVDAIEEHTGEIYRLANASRKEVIGDIVVALSQRSSSISDAVFTSVTQPVRYLGADRPLWSTILADGQVRQAIGFIDAGGGASGPSFDFLTGTVAAGGASGQSTVVANEALKAAADAIAASDLGVRGTMIERLKEAGVATQYPSVRLSVESVVGGFVQ